MPKCAVKMCKSNTLTSLKKDGKSYFRFPKNELEREKWRRIIANERSDEFYKPNNSSVVCSNHFRETDMYETKMGLRKVKKGAVPRLEIQTIAPSIPEPQTESVTNVVVKYERESSSSSTERSEPELKEVVPSIMEISVQNAPPSPTSSEHSSIFDSPEISYYKKTIRIYQEKMDLKSKQIRNLNKKVRRLRIGNQKLKRIVAELKKQRCVDKSLSTTETKDLNESSIKVIKIESVSESE